MYWPGSGVEIVEFDLFEVSKLPLDAGEMLHLNVLKQL